MTAINSLLVFKEPLSKIFREKVLPVDSIGIKNAFARIIFFVIWTEDYLLQGEFYRNYADSYKKLSEIFNNIPQGLKMQISSADLKIPLYVRLHIKTIPRKFAFLILRILEVFTREVCNFPKN